MICYAVNLPIPAPASLVQTSRVIQCIKAKSGHPEAVYCELKPVLLSQCEPGTGQSQFLGFMDLVCYDFDLSAA